MVIKSNIKWSNLDGYDIAFILATQTYTMTCFRGLAARSSGVVAIGNNMTTQRLGLNGDRT